MLTVHKVCQEMLEPQSNAIDPALFRFNFRSP